MQLRRRYREGTQAAELSAQDRELTRERVAQAIEALAVREVALTVGGAGRGRCGADRRGAGRELSREWR